MPRTLLVVNPRSANGSTARVWPALLARARALLGDVEAACTEGRFHAAELTRRALQGGFDRIVAVGGDGTNHEVVNGFFEGGRPVRPTASFACLPRGTGCDFLKTFGLPRDPEVLLARMARSVPRPIDVGWMRFTGPRGPEERVFLNVADFGIGGRTVARVNRTTKSMGGLVSFLFGTLGTFASWTGERVRVRVDDGPWQERTITGVNIANGQFFGAGMRIAPEARVDDGLFDVVIVDDMPKLTLLRGLPALYRGRHLGRSAVEFVRAARVEADADAEVLIDADGEQPGRLPAVFRVLPGALPLAL